MSLNAPQEHSRRRRVSIGLAVSAAALLLTLGIFASNGWLPRTDPLTGKKFGWFGKPLPQNVASTWNRFAAPAMPSGTPQLSKEYIYAGSRLLAVEDANASAGTPTPTPLGFEGDVAPRFLGDESVLADDVTQERRFVTGLDVPQLGTNEFQRADAAPFATLGDGIIGAGDVTQVRRYSTGLDPITAAGGPTEGGEGPEGSTQSPVAKGGTATESSSNREIRVLPATGRRGESITVPIQMKTERDEVAMAFTLEFDAARLSNPRTTLGTGLPTSTYLTTDTRQSGKIGILVDAEEPFSPTAGQLNIIYVTFDVRTTAVTGSSPIVITSSLARQGVADRMARLVATSYANSSISITN